MEPTRPLLLPALRRSASAITVMPARLMSGEKHGAGDSSPPAKERVKNTWPSRRIDHSRTSPLQVEKPVGSTSKRRSCAGNRIQGPRAHLLTIVFVALSILGLEPTLSVAGQRMGRLGVSRRWRMRTPRRWDTIRRASLLALIPHCQKRLILLDLVATSDREIIGAEKDISPQILSHGGNNLRELTEFQPNRAGFIRLPMQPDYDGSWVRAGELRNCRVDSGGVRSSLRNGRCTFPVSFSKVGRF